MSEEPEGLTIVVPSVANVPALLFLSAWLVGWAFGEVMATRQLLSDWISPSPPRGSTPFPFDLFLVAWLTMWTVGGAFAIYTWLWSACGVERIGLREGALVVRNDVLGLGRSREFDLAHVSHLRVDASGAIFDAAAFGRLRGLGVGKSGSIAFDYGAATVRFGEGLDAAEARMIVDDLTSRRRSLAATVVA